MSIRVTNIVKRTSLFLFAGIFIGYFCWIAIPLERRIKVYDSTGQSRQRIDLLITQARQRGAYPDSTVKHLQRETLWTPWRRAELFIDIMGTKDSVGVTAGFNGGPLYGAGIVFGATWDGAKWNFTDPIKWVS